MLPGERLKVARKELGLSLVALGKKTGYSHGHLSMVEGGKKDVSPRLLNLLELSLGINPDYITYGDGPMFSDEEPAQIEEPGLEDSGGDLAKAVPEHISELSLALRFFGAWAMRQAVKDAAMVGEVEAGLRRLQSEIDHGRLVALKQEAIAEPESWGEYLRSLVTVLPADIQRELTEWLAQRTSAGGTVRKPSPGHKRKVDGAG